MKVRIVALVLLALLLGVNVGAQSAQPVVIASHSILADVARNIAGDHLEVRTLIPAGSDPHHFVPTPSDLAAVADADLVLINGVGYEETLLEAIENAGVDVNIVVASACIDIRPASAHDEDHDDHEHEDDMHDDHDDHAHDDDDEHAHDEDHDDHGHEEDHDDHGHDEDHDDHGHDEDHDEHGHDEDHDEHGHDDDDELTGCDAQDAEFHALGFHSHGKFLGRAEDIECAGHDHGDHGDEHEDDHGDEHEDDHGDEHDDHVDEHGGHEEGACDPHIWFDPQNVIRWALTIRDSFSEIDPDHAADYHEAALAYAMELDALESEFIWPLLENLPEEKRLLVTAHDALGYLAGTFHFEIVSTVIPGVSTVVEPSASDVATVIDVIREQGLTAIFGESTTSDRILQVIAAETDVEIAPLYTDSLGQADGPAGTYLDYMRYNFTTIVEALSS